MEKIGKLEQLTGAGLNKAKVCRATVMVPQSHSYSYS